MKKFLIICSIMYTSFADANVNFNDHDLAESVRNLTGKNEESEQEIQNLNNQIKEILEEIQKLKIQNFIANKSKKEILLLVQSLITNNDTKQAKKILEAFTDNFKNVSHEMIYFYTGNCYYLEQNYEEAAKNYNEEYKINSKGSEAVETLYQLALSFKQLQKFNEYLATLKKILELYNETLNSQKNSHLKIKINNEIKLIEQKTQKLINEKVKDMSTENENQIIQQS